METYKTGTVNTIINENGVDLGNINVNLYTMDNMTSVIDIHLKKKNLISEQQEYIPVNFNQTKFKPILHVFAQDGSIFTNEPLEIIKPEEGYVRYIIPEYITKHVGQMQCKLFLENPENNDSSHVANFYFTVNDSGITKSIGKEIRVELLNDIVEKVMKNNVEIFKGPKGDKGEQGIPGQDGKDGKNGLNGIDGVNGNPGPQGVQGPPGKDGINGVDGIDGKPGIDGKDGADGAKGEPFRYDDFTPEQLEALRGPQGLPGPKLLYSDLSETEKKELKDALNNTAITDVQIQDKTITNQKLSDQYNTVKVLEANEDITKINREGLYFLSSNTSYVGVPEAVNVATFSGILRVSAYSQYHYTQEIHDLNNNGVFYSRVIKNNVNTKWKSYLDEEKLKVISNEQTNNKVMYNLNVFEKYSNEVIPDKNIVYANAIQDIRIEGVDKKTPVKIWTLSRAFGTWNYRIILGQKVNGVWSTLLDTGNNFTVTENTLGATTISYEKNGIKLTARVDYNLIPKNDRLLDHSTVTDEPYFIIRQEKIGSVATGGGGTAYDQSLNTTDSVKFASIKTDALDVSGTMPSGTLAQPPKVSKGDMWLDTTDSATHPIVRVML
ncbi:BppU family phage baseplate upper protein [Staphylococcus epidermidis]|uniref:BppU family phage baseplate upper protein n=1 Tax=Staphylococcus epidermidis TaxID=1282 RepID=UPI0021A687F2|nr:BppU family phage baseplate upper protein [Staphylococcus epidermidis]MCT2080682.1 BppU family phage baseplate upper protein [Staphylococcus epidermidis]MCT2111845.1 BppU family phage baseplate upper protein [Staphylococcus epidermidis]MCT2230604.1 BppU family phage baseplate upper protein [Staphylococcus epidermidis]MCT2315362.1 BppU family phage baseplate upper protein [Staphylococcus epidermidis]